MPALSKVAISRGLNVGCSGLIKYDLESFVLMLPPIGVVMLSSAIGLISAYFERVSMSPSRYAFVTLCSGLNFSQYASYIKSSEIFSVPPSIAKICVAINNLMAISIILKVMADIESDGRRFYFKDNGQSMVLYYLDSDTVTKLNHLTKDALSLVLQ